MEGVQKISTHFRKVLKQELRSWQSDGLLGESQAIAISQRYKLDETGKEASNRTILAIYIVGASLIGAGVISFVAAHWDTIAANVKITMIVSLMLACHIGGYYLWKISAKAPRLGHTLIILGTLIFGANIGLLAQIFHIKSNFYNGMYAWAIGAMVMAYAMESVPNAVIAIIVSFVGFCGWFDSSANSFCYYPFIAMAAFLPFAKIVKSKISFILVALVIGISTIMCTIINIMTCYPKSDPV